MATDLWLTRGQPQSTDSEHEGEGGGEKFDRNQKLKEVRYTLVHTVDQEIIFVVK